MLANGRGDHLWEAPAATDLFSNLFLFKLIFILHYLSMHVLRLHLPVQTIVTVGVLTCTYVLTDGAIC